MRGVEVLQFGPGQFFGEIGLCARCVLCCVVLCCVVCLCRTVVAVVKVGFEAMQVHCSTLTCSRFKA